MIIQMYYRGSFLCSGQKRRKKKKLHNFRNCSHENETASRELACTVLCKSCADHKQRGGIFQRACKMYVGEEEKKQQLYAQFYARETAPPAGREWPSSTAGELRVGVLKAARTTRQ